MIAREARPRSGADVRDLFRRDPRRFAAMLAIAFALTSLGLLALPRTTLAWSSNSFSSSSEKQLVSLTNQARASAGLKALKVDSTLTTIARSRSKDMIVRDYFSHTIPGGSNVFHILDTKGYCYKIAGENIGWNTYPDDVATAQIQSAFMGSSGHRANILGKAWDVIGIGAYKGSDGKKMWTVLFADRCGTTSTPKATPKPTARPRATPRPTPKPVRTPKPTPRPTPRAAIVAPTPEPSPSPVATQPFPSVPAEASPTAIDANPEPGSLPAGRVRDATPGSPEANLRVVDPASSPGLLEAVVAGVTGSFLGG